MLHKEEDWILWMDLIADHGFVVIDDFVNSELLSQLHAYFDEKIAEDDFKKAQVGAGAESQRVPEIRGDYIYWLDEDADTRLSDFFSLSSKLIQVFNRYCFLSLSASEFHLAEYPIGSFYKPHVDQFEGRSNRLITFLLYLNEDWKEGDGGELCMHLENEKLKIDPLNNRCVLFKSDAILHEVLPTNKARRSLTGWLLHQPSVLGSILG